MIDGSEKCNRQLASEFRIRMFVKSTVKRKVTTKDINQSAVVFIFIF